MSEKNSSVAAEAKSAYSNKNEKNGKGRGKKAPVWKVLNSSRTKFDAQVTKDTNVKRVCIEACIGKHYRDDLRFWLDFKTQSERLTDSVRFNAYCESRGLDPKNVSQHIVFESETKVNKVLRDGVASVMGERVMMFSQPLFRDKNNLYTDGGSEGQGMGKKQIDSSNPESAS